MPPTQPDSSPGEETPAISEPATQLAAISTESSMSPTSAADCPSEGQENESENEQDGDPEWCPNLAFRGQGHGVDRELSPEKLATLVSGESVPAEILTHLATRHSPDYKVRHLPFLDWLVVELPKMNDYEHWLRLARLPKAIRGIESELRYSNGPLSGITRVRPGDLPDADDRSTEVPFSPGWIIASMNGGTPKKEVARLLVEKDGERRLTIASDLWEQQRRDHPGLFGQDTDEAKRVFQLLQWMGENREYKPVGYAKEIMQKEEVSDPDICLVKLDDNVKFENTFNSLPALHKDDVSAFKKTFRPLEAAGWSVVPVPDPRRAADSLSERASETLAPEESSSKRAAPSSPLSDEPPLERPICVMPSIEHPPSAAEMVAAGRSIVPVPDPRQAEDSLSERVSESETPAPESESSKRAAPSPLLERPPLKRARCGSFSLP
jgi:hypothetical protein